MLVPALVKGKNGAIVDGLQAEDFIIEDDGVKRPVHLDEAPARPQFRWSSPLASGASSYSAVGRPACAGAVGLPLTKFGLDLE